MNDEKRCFPNKLYIAPESWGGFSDPMSDEIIEKIINFYNEEEGWDLEIEDCEDLTFIKTCPNGAIYEGGFHHDGYHRNLRRYGYIISMTGEEDFSVESQHDTIACAEDGKQ